MATATVHLTKPQQDLLRSLAEKPHFVAAGYKPFERLVALGFAEAREGRFSTVSHLTQAGRNALADLI